MHNANRDMFISVVIDNSVPEKSPMSAITDNNAPDKSDIVDGAHNSSLDINLCSSTCQTSSDIDESPQQPILKNYDPQKKMAVNHFLEISTQPGTSDIHG